MNVAKAGRLRSHKRYAPVVDSRRKCDGDGRRSRTLRKEGD
jgi:hypothetical protein